MSNNLKGKKDMVIITAPSGSGKTTIIQRLLKEYPKFNFSISATTRKPRANEIDKKDYYFISVEEFKNSIVSGDFLEWEMVYESIYYGTFHREIHRIQDDGKIPILDIDVQGALNLKNNNKNKIFSLFIKAPSLEELENRLRKRETDSDEKILERVEKAKEELTYQDRFDKIIVNDNLETAYNEVIKALKEQYELKN
ncbi:MAG TPA: guanylate kinase [Chitinophagaceae bacterium]|nr:guanylate kinase [Chitinophagaceae bacterium]